MIRHCVFLRLKAEANPGELADVMQGLSALVDTLPGCGGFAAGPNVDIEGKSPGIAHGFTFDAQDRAALETYATHPDHVALGVRLVALCKGGADGVTVVDLEAAY